MHHIKDLTMGNSFTDDDGHIYRVTEQWGDTTVIHCTLTIEKSQEKEPMLEITNN